MADASSPDRSLDCSRRRESSPSSPAFSSSLVNHNVFANIDDIVPPQSPNLVTDAHQPNRDVSLEVAVGSSSIMEFSPRSLSSDESSSFIVNSSGQVKNGKDAGAGGDKINNSDGSPLLSRGASTDDDLEITMDSDGIDLSGLPSALILANLPECLFKDADVKAEFESIYLRIDSGVKFGYFRCFRRARLAFTSPLIATRVRLLSQGSIFRGNTVKCYFHQSPGFKFSPRQLEPPEPERVFLISPPASPPVGWEGGREKTPDIGAITPSVLPADRGPITEQVAEVVQQTLIMRKSPAANITGVELLAALAKLAPGEQTEVLPPTPDKPGIVIETCEDAPGLGARKIQQTRRPDRN